MNAITQRSWRKDRGTIVRDILDRKGPLATMTCPVETNQFWVGLFVTEDLPIPESIRCGDISLLDPVSLEEMNS